ncbi:hypothetical protein KAJ89_02055 [Candidatus Parcubacteria bacterium]|nr:hypothetical protein [Candidatus Parcubacteria bacterium]
MKKFVFIIMILAVMGISGFNPAFIYSAQAAAQSSFSASKTVDNVTNSTIPAITLTGGVAEVSATTTLSLVASTSLITNEYIILTDSAAAGDAVCFYFDTDNSLSDDTTTAAACQAADGLAGGVELDVNAAASAIAVAAIVHAAINGVGAELLVTSADNLDGTLALTQDTAGTAGNIAVNAAYLIEAVANAGVILTSFSGGVNNTAASDTITVPAGLSANANDHSVTIDGVTVDLGTSLLTAAGLASAIAADLTVAATGTSYVADGAYTVSTSSADITFSRANATNGAIGIGDADYGLTAQEVTFTPSSVTVNETFNAVINGTTYSFKATGNTAQNVVEGLQPLMTANAAVTCTEDNVKVTCVADSAGTAFTYSVSITEAPASGGGTLISLLQQINEQRQGQTVAEVEISPETSSPAATDETGKVTLEQMITDAGIIASGDIGQIISAMGAIRDTTAEAGYDEAIVSKVVAGSDISAQIRNIIVNFVTYGTKATKALGAGERAGVVNSFQAAFGKLPVNSSDWNDVIKIANGRWPDQRDTVTETNAIAAFNKIYLRAPDRSDPHDDAAVTVISYGLRPADRNLDSEKAAIKSFEAIYGYAPVSAMAWDIVRAIAYSGATR